MILKLLNRFGFLIGLIISLSLLWPLFYASYFSHHDNVQLIRLYEMDKCIQDGQIPCRWVPDLGGLYGYPLFNYYAPLPYYFGEIFYILTHNLIVSAKIMFGFSFIFSYIFMYLCAKEIWGRIGALISGVFYVLAPYHSVDFYVRGAMGEMWALTFFPAIFWSLLRLRKRTSKGNLLLTSLFFGLLVLSHNLSAMIFIPPFITTVVFFYFLDKNKTFLKLAAIGLIGGLVISAFYWIPALVEKPLAHIETTIEGYFSYTEHFKGLRKLFLERSWGYGASIREIPGGPKDGLSYQVGLIHELVWIILIITVLLGFIRKKITTENREKNWLMVLFSVFILGSVFMIHPRSELIWKLISPLQYLQFPWRFLEIIIFFVSLIAGGITYFIKDGKLKNLLLVGSLVLVIALNFSYFQPQQYFNISDKDVLTGELWDQQIKRSIFDFLPIYAQEPPAELATSRYQILTGNTVVSNFKEGSNWFSFDTKTKTHSIIRVSQYYFPDWIILIDDHKVNIDYQNSLGLMTIILGVGNHTVSGRLYNTPVRTISNSLSFLAFFAFLGMSLLQIKKFNKWFRHYLEVLKK